MKTIEATAIVTPDGKIQIEDPNGHPEVGEYKVVLVFGEQTISDPVKKPRPKLKFNVLKLDPYPPEMTFRREDMYEDADR